MIDRAYKTVQAIANKEQLGYIKPYKFNLYVNQAIINVYNKLFSDVKTQVRKSNWMLDGKNLADYSENTKQLLEHFLFQKNIQNNNGILNLPDDCEVVQDLYHNETFKVDKVDLQDFNLLRRNNYAKPKKCSPIFVKIERALKILPKDLEELEISYIRKPKKAKWTFEEDNNTGKPMFDPTKNDFQDIDMPESLLNEIINDVLSQAGLTIRDMNVVSFANQEENREIQTENKQ